MDEETAKKKTKSVGVSGRRKVILGLLAGLVAFPLLIVLIFNWSNLNMLISVLFFGSDYLINHADDMYKSDSYQKYGEDGRKELYLRAIDTQGQYGPPVGSKTRAFITYRYGAWLSSMNRNKEAVPVLREAQKSNLDVDALDALNASSLLIRSHLRLGQYDQALNDSSFGLNLLKSDKVSDKTAKFVFLNNLAIANLELNKLEEAGKLSEDILASLSREKNEANQEVGSVISRASALASVACLKALKHQYPESIQTFKESTELLDKNFDAASPQFEENLALYIRSLYKAGYVKEADFYNKKLDNMMDNAMFVHSQKTKSQNSVLKSI